jgi:ribosome-binding factor A
MNFPRNILVTIIRVKTARDFFSAKVYFSVFPEKETKKVILMLKNNIYELQQRLNKRLMMRPVPRIEFLKEKETQEIEKIEEIFEKIEVEKEDEV